MLPRVNDRNALACATHCAARNALRLAPRRGDCGHVHAQKPIVVVGKLKDGPTTTRVNAQHSECFTLRSSAKISAISGSENPNKFL
jgi:hypothetical protein